MAVVQAMAVGSADLPCAGSCRHGTCVNGTCVCASGWSGNADLLTGDLTAWGGPVLDCTSHVVALQVVWSLAFALCVIALIAIPFAAHQQWHNYKLFRTQGARKHWYHYRPFLFVAGHAITLLVMLSIAAVKMTTPRFERVIGIDLHLTIAFSAMLLFGIPVTFVFLLELFATFSNGIRSEMAPSPRWHLGLRMARLLLVLAIFLVASGSLYGIAHLFISPISGRNAHVTVNMCWMGQCVIGLLFGSVALVAFAVDTVRNINQSVREREVLARWTRSRELRDSVASLRRTRLKIFALLIIVQISTTASGLALLWTGSSAARQQYNSYYVLVVFVCYVQIILSILHTYTTITVPSRKRTLRALGLSRLVGNNAVSPPGRISCTELAVAQQMDATSAAAQSVQDVTVSVAVDDVSANICTEENNGTTRGLPSNLSSAQHAGPLPPLPPQPQRPQHTQHTHQLHVLVEGEENGEQQTRSEQRPKWDC